MNQGEYGCLDLYDVLFTRSNLKIELINMVLKGEIE